MKRQLQTPFDVDKENQTELQDRFLWSPLGESSNYGQGRSIIKANQMLNDSILERQPQAKKKRRTHQVLSNITNTISQPNPNNNNNNNVSRRNERERNRVKLLNLGFDRLRAVVPCRSGEQLSKISTLKKAIWYIEHLDKVLHGQDWSDSDAVSDPDLVSTSTSKAHQFEVKLKTDPDILTGIAGIKGDQVGTGTSWPVSTTNSSSTICGKRSDNDRPPSSPIFPTYWDQQAIELTSTPRQVAPLDVPITIKSTNERLKKTFDSGYNTSGTNCTHQSLLDSSSRVGTLNSPSTHPPASIPLSLSNRPERTLTIPSAPSFDWTQSVPQLQWFLRQSMFKTNP